MEILTGANKEDSNRLIGELVDTIDDLLPEDYTIELAEDNSEIVIDLPANDEVLGTLRYTNERERGGCGGPDFRLRVVYAGTRPDEITTWFDLDQAISYLLGQCNFDD